MPALYYIDTQLKTNGKTARRWFSTRSQVQNEIGPCFDQRMVESVYVPKLTREAVVELLNEQPYPGASSE